MSHHLAEDQPAALVPLSSPAADTRVLDIVIARARARAADDACSRAFEAFQLACRNMEDAIRELRVAAAGPEQGGVQ